MKYLEPVQTVNLDRYGHDAIPWSTVDDALGAGTPEAVLGTIRPDGRPHAAAVGSICVDGLWYVVSGPETRKSRNLAANPACTLFVKLPGIDVVFEGEVERVTEPEELERIVAVYRQGGWPAEVEGDAFTAPYSAPSAGPPPWNLYRITCRQAFGVGEGGATKWIFDRQTPAAGEGA